MLDNNRQIHVSRVGSKTNPVKLASSIQHNIKESDIEIIAIGPDAIAIAATALCFAEEFAKKNNLNLKYKPSFKTVEDNSGSPRSAVSWMITREDI